MRLRFTVGGRSWELRSEHTLDDRRAESVRRRARAHLFGPPMTDQVTAVEPVEEAAPPPAAAAAPELDVDPVAQAATLREASRAGVPFCEECARLAAARGAS